MRGMARRARVPPSPPSLFDVLERSKMAPADCSLSDRVRAMAREAKARTVDIEGARWHDVDTASMLAHAEFCLPTAGPTPATLVRSSPVPRSRVAAGSR